MLAELAQLRAGRCSGTGAERTGLWSVAVVFHVAQHLYDAGVEPDLVGVLPAMLQSGDKGYLLLPEELVLLVASKGRFPLIH